MYIGSVRFFKHLILSTTALLIIIPSVLAIVFGVQTAVMESKNKQLEQSLNKQALELEKANSSLDAMAESKFESESLDYQKLYPDFYAPQPISATTVNEKVMYLTFDDGPSEQTPKVLEILQQNNIKATFFVTGASYEKSHQWMKDVVNAGHTIGMHTYCHDYNIIYQSVESFLDDMYKIFTTIKEATGVTPSIFRFAGGSVNSYNHGIYQEIIAEMLRRGFVPYDWNMSSQDAANISPSAATIIQNVTSQAAGRTRGIVLMHDSIYKHTTVEALPAVIDNLRKMGYSFDKLTPDIKPVLFGYIDD